MPKKILACDDEPYILAAVSRIVKDEGFSLITARDGEEALRLARVELPDLILLDIKMPRIDGFEVCRTLKSDSNTQGIPILLLTAMGQEQDAQLGITSGAQDYITKPFSPRVLKKRLHGFLDSPDRQSGLESLQDSVHSLTEELLTIYEELTLLYSLTARLGRLTDEDEIAAAALGEAKEVLSADSGWVVMWDSESPRVPRDCNLGIGAALVDEVNRAVIYPLHQEQKRSLILHTLEPKGPGEHPDQPGRLLASSITIGQAPEGYLCLARSGDHRIFTSADQKLIDAVASITAMELENVRLQHSELEKRRMAHELEMARRIQQWLLPRDLCCSSFLDGAGLSEPCYEIGGDYYDLFPLNEERCLLVIADVTGKGAPASLQAALMQGVVQGCSKHTLELLTIMSTLNECLLARAVQGNYPTAFLAVLDQTGQLRYTSAGHPAAILIRRSAEICELRDGGTFLGFLADPKYPLGTAQLEPGDLIVLYSDGVTDAENGNRETFGLKRVLDWAKTQVGRSPLKVRESLLSVVKDFCGGYRQGDDITALIVRYCGTDRARDAHSRDRVPNASPWA